MTTPQLTDPAPPPAAKPERKLYDQWGRYLLPDPDTGESRAWTRATTLAKALEDTYNLEVWSNRMTAKGMALRPDLLALAATLDVEVDKKRLNDVAKAAKEAAGGSSGANLGTALHSMTEKLDAGEDVNPGPFARELAAYRATLEAEGIVVLPRYSERIVCVPELGVAGRLDKLAEYAGQNAATYQVMDLKSQKSMDFGGLSIAVQLSLYAHAYAMWDPATETWEDPPPIDPIMATVIWLPVGQGVCQLYDVDLVQGWKWAKLSAEVRQIRKCKPVTMRGSMRPASAAETYPPMDLAEDRPADSLAALGQTFVNAAKAGAPPFEGPNKVMDWDREKYPALMKAAADVDATEGDIWRDPYREPDQWADVFRHCLSLDELTYYGQRAMKALGGQLPPELKELGRELREKLANVPS